MHRKLIASTAIILALSGNSAVSRAGQGDTKPVTELSGLKKIAEISPRFQSYNVEMVEVTGGRFWAPYGGPKGEVYRMRPPLDLSAKRIRALAKNLGPAFVRVSGTWANNSYIPAEGEKVSAAPAGYKQVLTRDQWRGVVTFAKAVDAQLVTSFAVSDGTRGPDQVWKADQAQRLIDLTKQAGGKIYGAEFFNEPNIPGHGSLPQGYSADNYIRDFRIFQAWVKKSAPAMKIFGPGSAAEGSMMKDAGGKRPGFLSSDDLMRGNPNSVDIMTYHYYGGVSQRCAGPNSPTVSQADALSAAWLDRTLIDYEHYAALRNKYEPGKPMWLNETAQAACGGSPWASTFTDSFRYLNQLGILAQKGVQVVAHNTLAASDYALVDYDSMMPRPNYWAAVLWRRTMGTTVLASPASPSPDMRLYAHCFAGKRGGVAVLAINTGTSPQSISIGNAAKAWVMSAKQLGDRVVTVNGQNPVLRENGTITGLDSVTVRGAMTVPATSIAFLAVQRANNKQCR